MIEIKRIDDERIPPVVRDRITSLHQAIIECTDWLGVQVTFEDFGSEKDDQFTLDVKILALDDING